MVKNIIFSLCLLLIGCGNSYNADYTLNKETFTAEHLKMIEKDTTLKLPKGSFGVNMLYIGSQSIDPSFLARIEIPKKFQDDFIQYIKQLNNNGGSLSNSLIKDVNWWDPEIIRVERSLSVNNGDYLHVILSEDRGKLMLYLEWVKI